MLDDHLESWCVTYVAESTACTASLAIHQKSCKKLFLQREAKKPKQERKPLPKEPTNISDYENATPRQVEAARVAASRSFNDNVLERCPNCSRTFLPDRLVVHLRSCTKISPAKQSLSSRQRALTPPSSSKLPKPRRVSKKSLRSIQNSSISSTRKDTQPSRMPKISSTSSSSSGEWKRSQTSEGADYFYHSGSGKVQWNEPSGDQRRSNGIVDKILPKLEVHAASLERKLASAQQELDSIKSLIATLRDGR
eukprot:g4977.t1